MVSEGEKLAQEAREKLTERRLGRATGAALAALAEGLEDGAARDLSDEEARQIAARVEGVLYRAIVRARRALLESDPAGIPLEEAAAVLRLEARTLSGLAREGRSPVVAEASGKTFRFNLKALEEFAGAAEIVAEGPAETLEALIADALARVLPGAMTESVLPPPLLTSREVGPLLGFAKRRLFWAIYRGRVPTPLRLADRGFYRWRRADIAAAASPGLNEEE
jgi:hypothetical protein